jgi:hypothetical protein
VARIGAPHYTASMRKPAIPLDRRGRRAASQSKGSAALYCTGVSLKRQEYCLLNAAISRVFTLPVRFMVINRDACFSSLFSARVYFAIR